MLRQSCYLADRIETAAGPNLKEQVDQAFRIVFNRPPNEEEMEILRIRARRGEPLRPLADPSSTQTNFSYFD
jgi:hypothetical protein